MLAILEEKGLVEKHVVDGSLYRGLLVLTKEGQEATKQVPDSDVRIKNLIFGIY